MTGTYLYLAIAIIVFVLLLIKVVKKIKHEKESYQEREDNVFYDNVKNIRRDR